MTITTITRTKRKSRKNPDILKFLIENISIDGVTSFASKKFGVSRKTINLYIQSLEDEGLILAEGKTAARKYKLKNLETYLKLIDVTPALSENNLWIKQVAPHLVKLNANVRDICQYGFTEIMNNVIDHSESLNALISYKQTASEARLTITDYGVGIFEKIKKDFDLEDSRAALLELSKGKLTSDSTRHAGEGIFFTSRMFNYFSILSGNLYYSRSMTDDWGWLTEVKDKEEYFKGTSVSMTIDTHATWRSQDVFKKFVNEETNFSKTHVPLSLGSYGSDQLVSRSQAKRILARFDKFEEVFLDFSHITFIGQAFADEIFRVYANQHPEISIIATNTHPDVEKMIDHVKGAKAVTPE